MGRTKFDCKGDTTYRDHPPNVYKGHVSIAISLPITAGPRIKKNIKTCKQARTSSLGWVGYLSSNTYYLSDAFTLLHVWLL